MQEHAQIWGSAFRRYCGTFKGLVGTKETKPKTPEERADDLLGEAVKLQERAHEAVQFDPKTKENFQQNYEFMSK